MLAALLPEGPAAYPADQLTDRDERFFAAEILREKLFLLLGEELPYRCDVSLESFKEEGRACAASRRRSGSSATARSRS